jgi:protein-tyrosine-phosphatase
MKQKNLLFVCKYNVFRSKVAEAYFNKINKNKNIKASSAGIISETKRDYRLTELCKKLGLRLKGESKGITIKLIKQSDLIIIVANDVPKQIFKYNKEYLKKVILWKIKDVPDTEKNITFKRKIIIKQIIKKINKLNKNIEKNKIKW